MRDTSDSDRLFMHWSTGRSPRFTATPLHLRTVRGGLTGGAGPLGGVLMSGARSRTALLPVALLAVVTAACGGGGSNKTSAAGGARVADSSTTSTSPDTPSTVL